MLAAGPSKAGLEPYMAQVNSQLQGELIIACFNSPKNNTVSGDEAKIDALKSLLDKDGVFARKLNVANAYHSAHMREVADIIRQQVSWFPHGKHGPPTVTVHVSLTVSV